MAAERHDSRLADGVFPDCIAELFGQSREVGEERETEETGDEVYGSHHCPRIEVSIEERSVANLCMRGGELARLPS